MAISEYNLGLMFEQGRSFDEYFRYLEEQNYVDAQTGLLETEDIEPLPEEDDAEAGKDVADGAVDMPEGFEGEASEAGVVAPIEVDVPEAPLSPASPLAPAAPNPGTPKPGNTKPAKPVEPAKPTPVPVVPGNEGDDDPLLLPDEDFEP